MQNGVQMVHTKQIEILLNEVKRWCRLINNYIKDPFRVLRVGILTKHPKNGTFHFPHI